MADNIPTIEDELWELLDTHPGFSRLPRAVQRKGFALLEEQVLGADVSKPRTAQSAEDDLDGVFEELGLPSRETAKRMEHPFYGILKDHPGFIQLPKSEQARGFDLLKDRIMDTSSGPMSPEDADSFLNELFEDLGLPNLAEAAALKRNFALFDFLGSINIFNAQPAREELLDNGVFNPNISIGAQHNAFRTGWDLALDYAQERAEEFLVTAIPEEGIELEESTGWTRIYDIIGYDGSVMESHSLKAGDGGPVGEEERIRIPVDALPRFLDALAVAAEVMLEHHFPQGEDIEGYSTVEEAARKIWSTDEVIQSWLHGKNIHLGWARPIDVLKIHGPEPVLEALKAAEELGYA